MIPTFRAPQIRVMFLGGRLDHAIRAVTASVIEPGRPAMSEYHLPGRKVVVGGVHLEDEPAENYVARQIAIPGKGSWWIYVLKGYDPSRQHVLDTNPYPL